MGGKIRPSPVNNHCQSDTQSIYYHLHGPNNLVYINTHSSYEKLIYMKTEWQYTQQNSRGTALDNFWLRNFCITSCVCEKKNEWKNPSRWISITLFDRFEIIAPGRVFLPLPVMKYLFLCIPASFRVYPSLSLFRLGPFIMRNFFLLSHLYV